MSAIAILKLERSGFTSSQVEALAEYLDGQAASAADLDKAKTELKADIAEVRGEIAEVRGEIAEVKLGVARVEAELKAEIAEVRAEVARVAAELKADIARVETGIETEIRDLDRRMTIKLGAMTMAAVAAVATLVKLL